MTETKLGSGQVSHQFPETTPRPLDEVLDGMRADIQAAHKRIEELQREVAELKRRARIG